jgi:hypothetical protein
MTCGTLHPSLTAGVARPSVGGGSDVLLGILGGFNTSIHQVASKQTWMKEWNVRPAYPVTHTDRPTQRPLERSP